MTKAPQPKKRELFFLRVFILVGLGYALYFCSWFFDSQNIDNTWLFSIISIGVVYRIIRLFHQWFHLFILKSKRETPELITNFTVDVLTTYCPGEPYEMVENTLLACKKITYSHNTILCSEGDDKRLEQFCKENDIQFVPRYERTDAKAGNINNALKQSKAEICVILDPDHIPKPDFLDVVLPHFEDEKIGFVQVPQIYYNQEESAIAKAAAQQTYEFYGPLMNSMNGLGTVQAIGANCTFRRYALDSIGGHAPGLTEDMHTSMLLHAKGWKSIFVPEVVSEGLVPVTKLTYFKQQLKWSRGSFDLLFKVLPKIFSKLTFTQKIHYLTIPLYFLFGLFVCFDFIIPITSLWTGEYPLQCRMDDLGIMLLPLISLSLFIKQYAQRWYYFEHEKGFHINAEIMRVGVWWINILGFIYTIVGKEVPYIPTPKDDKLENEFKIAFPNVILLLIVTITIIVGLSNDWSSSSFLMVGYLSFLGFILLMSVLMGFQLTFEKFRKGFVNRITSNFFRFLIHKMSLLLVVLSFVGSMFYFFNYRDSIRELGDVEPPDFKDVGGYYFAHKGKSNLEVITVDSSFVPSEDIDNNIFQLYRTNYLITDSIQLVTTLEKFTNIKSSTFFLDLLTVNTSISANEYKQLWKIQYDYCLENKIKPTFVFSIDSVNQLADYYPDAKYLDWINYNYNNFQNAKFNDVSYQLDQVYHPLQLLKKPLMVSNFAMQSDDLFNQLKYDYSELKAIISSATLAVGIMKLASKSQNAVIKREARELLTFNSDKIKGVYYNVAQDWKDDFQSLTAKSIAKNFKEIKAMGTNTILRYGPTMGDRNIFNEAFNADLNVLYGFKLEESFDYLDTDKCDELKNEIISTINQYKDYESIIGWNFGNEVIGKLELHYGEPYLTQQRVAYLLFVNDLVKSISEIDNRPISVHLSAGDKLNYKTELLRTYCSNLDYIGIGVQYNDQLNNINSNGFKYYISHFGVDGASDFDKNNSLPYRDVDGKLKANIAFEASDLEKSNQLIDKWKMIENQSIGGFVDGWSDKMDASLTWSGLTDYKGRFKPSYYQMKKEWNKTGSKQQFPTISIVTNRTYFEEDSIYQFDYKIDNWADFNQVDWVLCKDNVFPLSQDYIKQTQNGALVRLPNDESNNATYRLFLFVSDGENVTTTSYFLPLRWYYK